MKGLAESEDLPVRYDDLALITCAVISACAAWRWPGERIDKKRFVELLVKCSPSDSHTSWVSVPALVNASMIGEDHTPWGVPGNATRICRDEEVDVSLEDARTRYPDRTNAELRRHCYASLIYQRLRCAYMHEYRSGEDIAAYSWERHSPDKSLDSARVSYGGEVRLSDTGAEMRRKRNAAEISPIKNAAQMRRLSKETEIRRTIHFHLDYLIELAQHHVSIMPPACEPRPDEWWVDQAGSP